VQLDGRVLGLSLALCTLAAVVGQQVFHHPDRQPPEASPLPYPSPIADGPTSPDPTQRHDDWLNQILSRPLFSPSRTPIEAPAGPTPELPRLTAVIANGPQRIGIFVASPGERGTVVEIGSRIGIYDVQDINDGQITIAGPQGIHVLHPSFDGAPPDVTLLTQQAATRTPHPSFFKVNAAPTKLVSASATD
jgi:hypothetical protein